MGKKEKNTISTTQNEKKKEKKEPQKELLFSQGDIWQFADKDEISTHR